MFNILTVDTEEWYHICDVDGFIPSEAENCLESRIEMNVKDCLELFANKGVTATFFVLGSVAERKPDLVKLIKKNGHEIATHGFSHLQIYKQNSDKFREDLLKSIEILEDVSSGTVKGYRAPEWSMRKDTYWALDILLENGIEYDSSIFPVRIIGDTKANRYIHPISRDGGSILEFPPSTLRVMGENIPFSGGIHFRVFPYWFVEKAIRTMNKEEKPAIIYLHPWELDFEHPFVPLPRIKRFVHYTGLKTAKKKVIKLLENFRFCSIRDFLSAGEKV